jgi:hypothetical protein
MRGMSFEWCVRNPRGRYVDARSSVSNIGLRGTRLHQMGFACSELHSERTEKDSGGRDCGRPAPVVTHLPESGGSHRRRSRGRTLIVSGLRRFATAGTAPNASLSGEQGRADAESENDQHAQARFEVVEAKRVATGLVQRLLARRGCHFGTVGSMGARLRCERNGPPWRAMFVRTALFEQQLLRKQPYSEDRSVP